MKPKIRVKLKSKKTLRPKLTLVKLTPKLGVVERIKYLLSQAESGRLRQIAYAADYGVSDASSWCGIDSNKELQRMIALTSELHAELMVNRQRTLKSSILREWIEDED